MTSGGQCVMTHGIALMLLWSASSWDILSLEVSALFFDTVGSLLIVYLLSLFVYIDGRAFSNAHFGVGSGPIFLDDVQCTSSSSQLLACPSRPILSHNCLHSADAGVGCEGTFCNGIEICKITSQNLIHIYCKQFLAQLVRCDWQEVMW